MKIISKIIYGIFALTLVLIVGLFFLPNIPFVSGQIDIKIVKSGSMEPNVKTGSIVMMRPSESYNKGDIITFSSAGADIPTTHRIVEVMNEGGTTMFMTKGDANEEADSEPVPLKSVLGKVLFTIPYAGFVLDFARQPMGFLFLIGLPALLIVLDEVEKIWREVRRIRKETPEDEMPAPLIVTPFVAPRVRRRMMDINQPVTIAESRSSAGTRNIPITRQQTSRPPQGWVMAPCVVLMFSTVMVSLWSFGATISYFSDIETALANELSANALDFSATLESDSTFSFVNGILPNGLVTIVAPEEESVDLQYSLSVEFASGTPAFCDSIWAETLIPFSYTGPLLVLNEAPVEFDGEWTLDVTLSPGAYIPGDLCVVDLVYTAWNAELDEETPAGYEDEERIRLTFTAPEVAIVPLIHSADSLGATVEESITETETDIPPATVEEEGSTTPEPEVLPEEIVDETITEEPEAEESEVVEEEVETEEEPEESSESEPAPTE